MRMRGYFTPSFASDERYLRVTAAARSTSLMFASVQSQAMQSANSSSMFLRSSLRARARASSPNSSQNHSQVAAVPRARSVDSYLAEMCFWNAARVRVVGSCIMVNVTASAHGMRKATEAQRHRGQLGNQQPDTRMWIWNLRAAISKWDLCDP